MKEYSLFAMAGFYITAGINHFRDPNFYLKMMPKILPWPRFLNYLSGFLEIIFGIGVLFEPVRDYALWGIILLLIAVFPANLEMVRSENFKNIPLKWKLIRLPFQLLFIGWAYYHLS